ncbi:MAG: hypothetical protein JW723_15215 [Bacteroidales bacterium]|nr:hypothetical protein [Bacteroidales bacterium]
MKKLYTLIIGLILFALSGLTGSAQIQDFDPGKYYRIFMGTGGNTIGGNVLGVSFDATPNTQIAQLQPYELDTELWQIIQITDTTYRLINRATELALDRTTERPATSVYKGDGTHGDIGQSFVNSGWPGATDVWPAFAVQVADENVPTQEWAIIPIDPANHPADTVYYSFINVGMEYDSLFSLNVWRKRSGPDFYGTQNFCLLSYINSPEYLKEAEGKMYFIKSVFDTPVSFINSDEEKSFRVFVNNGIINITGTEYGQSVQVYTILGTLLSRENAVSSEVNIKLEDTGIYIIKVGSNTLKVLIQ